LVGDTLVGNEVAVKLIRNGVEKSIGVKVGQLDNTAEKEKKERARANNGESLGLLVSKLTDVQRSESKLKEGGVYISKVIPNSIAEKAGFINGDIVRSFDNKAIRSPDDLRQAVKSMPKDKPVAVLILRGQQTRFLAVVKK
jgi:serine protease Do